MMAAGPEVELIPPRSTLQRQAPQEREEPAPRDLQAGMLPLTALSFGLGVAMMPVFATMFVILVPVRWMFGEPARR